MSDRLSLEQAAEARQLQIVQRALADRPVRPVATPPLADTLVRFDPAELRTPPVPREYVWAPRVPAGRVAVLVGAGGTSKTGMALAVAVAMALGEPLFGSPTTQGRVLILTAEDRAEDLHRHLYELTRGRTAEELQTIADNVLVHDVAGRDFKLVRQIDGAAAVTYQAQELANSCREHGVALCIIDTASRTNAADESNEAFSRLIEACELIAREAGCAVLLSHHTGKQQMRDGVADQYGHRGGTALSDNARSVLQLSVVKDAKRAPVADGASLVADGRLLCLSHTKANFSAKADDLFLRRDPGAYAAVLTHLPVRGDVDHVAETWRQIAAWLAEQTEVAHPTATTVDGLDRIGTRADRRQAIAWALDRDLVREVQHPNPRGKRGHYLQLPDAGMTYSEASRGH